MKRVYLLMVALLLALPCVGVSDPGNVVSWFNSAPNELTFTCQTAVVKLEMLDAYVARVRITTNNVPFSTDASFTVVRNWPRPPMRVIEGDPLVVNTANLRVDVQKTPFRLTFRKPDGTVLLTDTNTLGLDCGSTNRSASFLMSSGEQFYGLGLVLGQPLSYRNQSRTLYNARARFERGAMTDMAVPLVVSTRDYGVFVDNTFKQQWDLNKADGTQWQVTVNGGEMDYYFIAGSRAEVLDRYTQMTGRSPLPPRWTLGYMQSKFGYRNWDEVFAVRDAFRTNDLPCDGIILDLYWFGEATGIGSLSWATNTFPNAASNIAVLGASGMKVINIHEPYINRDSARSSPNFKAAAALHYLVSKDAEMTQPSIVVNGLFGRMGYFDFLNPTARGWWFEKLRPIINDGVAAHWTDLGEPEQDHPDDFLIGGRCESEIHNVYNLLWHRAVAEGYATNYPTQRLFMLSRSGFAGDQRFGAAHWSNDVSADWPTLAAHPNALCNYGMSGMSYFGSDIGGFSGMPSNELYVRWFQFGAFNPVFRAHGVRKPVAPYEFSSTVLDCCRDMLKLRYRLLPYIYTAARETYDTGLPMCRALPLAFPNDANVLNDGSEFMFGPSILVAPVTAEGAMTRSVYLPAGKWIDHWSGQVLTGPLTTNCPAPITQIPLFYRDNSIIPLGPDVASSQFDDGSRRALLVFCSTSASVTLYDDDGTSNGYRSNEFATTKITATRSKRAVTIKIAGAKGSFRGKPRQRSWDIEVFTDENGWVRAQLPSAPIEKPLQVSVPLQPR